MGECSGFHYAAQIVDRFIKAAVAYKVFPGNHPHPTCVVESAEQHGAQQSHPYIQTPIAYEVSPRNHPRPACVMLTIAIVAQSIAAATSVTLIVGGNASNSILNWCFDGWGVFGIGVKLNKPVLFPDRSLTRRIE
jgi:hypothetical protein